MINPIYTDPNSPDYSPEAAESERKTKALNAEIFKRAAAEPDYKKRQAILAEVLI